MQTQVALLLHIIKTNFAELQLAKVFCQILTITESAAYRKLNGKSDITVAEFFTLLQHFKIDSSLFLNDENTYNFEGKLVYNNDTNVEQYFKDTLVFLEKIEHQNGILYNLSKDVPLFYYFHYTELGWFKVFFMLKYILLDPLYTNKKFAIQTADHKILDVAKAYSQQYQLVNTVEVWNTESINTTLHQLEYFIKMEQINDDELIKKLFGQLLKTIQLVQHQTKVGKKYTVDKYKNATATDFNLYQNDLYMAHNSYHLSMPNLEYAFVSFGVFNYIYTTNKKFTDYSKNHFENIIDKSLGLVNVQSSSDLFFTKIINKITQLETVCITSVKELY